MPPHPIPILDIAIIINQSTMIIFSTFEELLNKLSILDDDAFFYIPIGIPFNQFTKIAYMKEDDVDESIEINDDLVPIEIHNANMKSLIEVTTFRDIIDLYSKKHPNASNDEFFHALLYYLEHDDFLE